VLWLPASFLILPPITAVPAARRELSEGTIKSQEPNNSLMGKDWIKKSLLASGALRLAGRLRGSGVAIVMYHAVMDDPRQESQTLGSIIHSSEVFARQMELIARKYVAVSLDEVLQSLTQGRELPPRSVVVTFDDGYADNHDIAMPVLNRVGIPATFYVTVDCVETRTVPWPSRLRYAFYTTKQISWIDINNASWPLGNPSQRDQAFLKACDLCAQLAGAAQHSFVADVEKRLRAGPPPSSEKLMMTWEQVVALAKNGHIVGSHTLTHPNMAYLDEASARTELTDSKRRLEEILGSLVVHFSYPCPALSPHWDEKTRKMSQDAGYQTAVTTAGGPVSVNDDLLSLHRVRPSKEVNGFLWNLECTFLGRPM
jgi:peptidoglycan/xylan/chitin deacetylase (PgdA/CDA1 family)